MNKKAMQAITEALRDALTAYSVLEQTAWNALPSRSAYLEWPQRRHCCLN
jgi:hypothetical protein